VAEIPLGAVRES